MGDAEGTEEEEEEAMAAAAARFSSWDFLASEREVWRSSISCLRVSSLPVARWSMMRRASKASLPYSSEPA